MSVAKQAHWKELDGLRGILAFGIVVFHFGFNSFTERTLGWNGFSFQLAVDVFFILSGFVLAHSNRLGTNFTAFCINRFIRLAPVFYVTTLIAVVASNRRFSPLEIFLAVPFTGNEPINFPAWSICWELYLPMAATLMPFRIPERAVIPVLLISLMSLGILDIGVASGEQLYFPRALFGLLTGFLLYKTQFEFKSPLAPIYIGLALTFALSPYIVVAAFLVPTLACLAVLSGREHATLLSSKPFQFLGAISYTLYLSHIPVLMLLTRLFGDGVDANPALKVVGIAGAIALASLITYCIERPLLRYKWRLAATTNS